MNWGFPKKSTLLLLLSPFMLQAQMGTLDNTFGIAGKITASVSSDFSDQSRAVTVQADGKIIVVGTMYNGTDNDIIVLRYEANGLLDNTFDGDGKVTIDAAGGNDYANAVVVQNDGDILVGGSTSFNFVSDFLVARLKPNGSLDPTFADNGLALISLSADNDEVNSICLYSNGNILLGGSLDQDPDQFMSKYVLGMTLLDPTGLPVGSFGNAGIAKDTMILNPGGVAIVNDDKIVATGESDSQYLIVGRYTSTGAFDNTFDTDHLATSQKAGLSKGSVIAVQSDGKIVAAGTKSNGSKSSVAIFRFTTSGALDNTFSADGMDTLSIGSYNPIRNDFINGLVITTKGKIVLGGHFFGFSPYAANMFMIQYTSAGLLDTGFDSDGKNSFSVNGFQLRTSNCQSVALQADGKLLLTGYALNNGNFQYTTYTLRVNGEAPAVLPVQPTITTQPTNISNGCENKIASFNIVGKNITKYTWQKYQSNTWGYDATTSSINGEGMQFTIKGSKGYLAYSDIKNSGIGTILKFNNGVWEAVSGTFSTGSFTNLQTAQSGDTLYVAYADNANGGKLTVKSFNGTAWTDLNATSLASGSINTIALNVYNNVPYVSYSTTNNPKITVKKYSGSSWVTVGSTNFSAGAANAAMMEFSGSTPYLTYVDTSLAYNSVVKKIQWIKLGRCRNHHRRYSRNTKNSCF